MRTQTDCLRDIYNLEQRRKSNRKSANTTPNAKTAGIADATLPAIDRAIEALRAELPTLPDSIPREIVANQTFKFRFAEHFASDMPDLTIPEFLRRNPAAKHWR